MVKYVFFKSDMSREFLFWGGMLMISDSLTPERKLEIIKRYLTA